MKILSELQMRCVAIVCLVAFLLPVMPACSPDVFKPLPPAKVSFARAMWNPVAYKQRHLFCEGIVVFKKRNRNVSAVVIAPYPFPKVATEGDLKDDQVVAVKLANVNYDKVKIGSIVEIEGWMSEAKKNGKHIFYLEGREVTVKGQEPIADPDFEKLVNIVSQKAENNATNFALFFMLYITIIHPLLFDD
jgi:hypothetical protein